MLGVRVICTFRLEFLLFSTQMPYFFGKPEWDRDAVFSYNTMPTPVLQLCLGVIKTWRHMPHALFLFDGTKVTPPPLLRGRHGVGHDTGGGGGLLKVRGMHHAVVVRAPRAHKAGATSRFSDPCLPRPHTLWVWYIHTMNNHARTMQATCTNNARTMGTRYILLQ